MRKRIVLLLMISAAMILPGCNMKYNPDRSERAVDARMSKLLEKDDDVSEEKDANSDTGIEDTSSTVSAP